MLSWKKGQDLGFEMKFTDGTDSEQYTSFYIELGFVYLSYCYLTLQAITLYVIRLKENLE